MSNELVLVESQSARNERMAAMSDERALSVLEKAKALVMAVWQGSGIATTEQMAEYFEVSLKTVQKAAERHRDELSSDGLRVLKDEELRDLKGSKELRDTMSVSSHMRQLAIWTPRSALRLAMLLRDSKVAKQVRTILLDAVEAIPAQQRHIRELELQVAEAKGLPTAGEIVDLAERSIALMERLGGLDERDCLLFKDVVRNTWQREPIVPSAEAREWTISDRCLHLGYGSAARPHLQAIGKRAAQLYYQQHGCKPPKRQQYVAGAPRMINHYRAGDVGLLDMAISKVMQSFPATGSS